MQTLQVVQKNFNSLGFDPKLEPFNRTVLSFLILAFSGISLQWIFLFHGADSSQKHMETISIASGCTAIILSFTATIFISTELFSFINSFDDLTNES